MHKLLMMAAALVMVTTPSKADIVLATPGDILGSFLDVGAQGFGNFHRALTLQNNDIEFGARGFLNTQVDEAINGADKGNTPTLGQLQWNNGLNVGIGFNSNQSGNTGISLDALRLTVWDTAGNLKFTAALANPITFSAAILALQQGNGNSVFDFGLDATERAEFNAMLAANGGLAGAAGSFTVGLSAVLGCGTEHGVTFNFSGCLVSNDGADSFTLFSQTAAVPGPEIGTGLPGILFAGAVGMVVLARRRRADWPMIDRLFSPRFTGAAA